jgi:2-dehydropantoate 2-reductase
MRVAVLGAGGQGGFFGGRLAAAGERVTLIDRGAHLESIRRGGLTLRPAGGEPTTVRVTATGDPASVGPVDLVLLGVKTYDVADALAAMGPLVGPDTAILSVQNGVDAPFQIARSFGAGRVIAGASYVAAWVEEPGVVAFGGVMNRIVIGSLEGEGGHELKRVARALRSAGVEAEVSADIEVGLWEKMVLVCATGGVMALLRLSWGPVLESPVGREVARRVMAEAEAVGRASGVGLGESTAERVFEFSLANIDPSTRSSMLTDLLAGRRLELDALNGTIVRLGLEHGEATPFNEAVCSALKPFVDGAPGRGA